MEWILVSEKKPKEGQYVIVYALGCRMIMSLYKNEKFLCYDIRSEELEVIEEPTHWMNQPEKPKII
jgi:hypothetical protein